ncbi:hypothetical protein EV421DRAFT_1928590 [Armillaria borealis]|uniref:Uncharacterized protein n=1 Tax=Armillaria borealis TaxID=47425 RepID=A0AA39JQS3_9AGAR|nr:hypothetical protein EV421DRAFT_1928590 [Armillaria borealis]
MAGSKHISYDDRRTDVLKYNDQWFNTGFCNASCTGETGMLTSASNYSARVTFAFSDPANAFFYYGIRRCYGGKWAICINCNPADPNFEFINAVKPLDDGKNLSIILFFKNFDKPGIHTVNSISHSSIPRIPGTDVLWGNPKCPFPVWNSWSGFLAPSLLSGSPRFSDDKDKEAQQRIFFPYVSVLRIGTPMLVSLFYLYTCIRIQP